MASEVELVTPTAADRPRPDGSDIRKMTMVESAGRSRARPGVLRRSALPLVRPRRQQADARTRTRLFDLHRASVAAPGRGLHPRAMIGAALWMPPNTWHMGPLAQLLCCPRLRDCAPTRRGCSRRSPSSRRSTRASRAHWYLPIVGIAPAWQGRGYGAALLRAVLERCDTDRVPAYLEASSARSRALYERKGFEAVEECRYAKDGPPLWRMWREPKG